MNDEGIDIVTKWANYLHNLDASCVEIGGDSRIIDYGFVEPFAASPRHFTDPHWRYHSLFESERLVSLWETFSRSPVLTTFKWSSIIYDSVDRNLERLFPPRNSSSSAEKKLQPLPFMPGLVTAHVRRLDFDDCELDARAAVQSLRLLIQPWTLHQTAAGCPVRVSVRDEG